MNLVRLCSRQIEISLSHPLLKVDTLATDPILTVLTGQGVLGLNIEHEHVIRHRSVETELVDLSHFFLSEPSSPPLICNRGVVRTIAHYPGIRIESRHHDLASKLRTLSGKEEHLGPVVERVGVQKQFPNRLTHRCSPRLADDDHVLAKALETIGERLSHGAFSTPVSTLESDVFTHKRHGNCWV